MCLQTAKLLLKKASTGQELTEDEKKLIHLAYSVVLKSTLQRV